MVKVLVTGGAGFIGSNFVRYSLQTHPDWHVTTLDKLTYAGRRENLHDVMDNPRHRFVHGDICDAAAAGPLVEASDYVVHFAAETHVDRSIMAAGDFIKTDVEGSFVLLEAARRNPGLKRFVQISTDEVYGSVPEGSSTETDELRPRNPYAASKAGADRLAYSYWATHDVPVIVTRASNNYGPYQFPEKIIPLFEQRDDLFGKLVRAVVVRGARDDHRHVVRRPITVGQAIGAGLARRIRVARPQLVGLGARAFGHAAVDFVGRNLHEALQAGVPSRRFEQDERALDVGLDEIARRHDRAVDVGLRGEMHDVVGRFDQRPGHRRIADVAVHERVAGVVHHVVQVFAAPRVGQLVEIGDVPVGMGPQRIAHEIAADESGAAGYENLGHQWVTRRQRILIRAAAECPEEVG